MNPIVLAVGIAIISFVAAWGLVLFAHIQDIAIYGVVYLFRRSRDRRSTSQHDRSRVRWHILPCLGKALADGWLYGLVVGSIRGIEAGHPVAKLAAFFVLWVPFHPFTRLLLRATARADVEHELRISFLFAGFVLAYCLLVWGSIPSDRGYWMLFLLLALSSIGLKAVLTIIGERFDTLFAPDDVRDWWGDVS